jgi:serine/threonine-protein kinase HipA
VTYDALASVVLVLTGQRGRDFVGRLVAMIIVGKIDDAHLRIKARYPAGAGAELAPVYDFHSLTVYDRFRFTPSR